MEVVREIDNFCKVDQPLYLALGNFDGVHRGHQKLVLDLVEKARANQGIAAAFIFEPHPATVLNPIKAPKLLVTPERKAELLHELGMEKIIYNSFNQTIARWSPEEFVEKILVKILGIKAAFVGFNHSFGYKGAGNPELLSEFGKRYGFEVNVIPPVEIKGQVVSSTLIRQALDSGDVKWAAEMLGYYPMIEGEIIQGEQRGTTNFGFPRTANLGISAELNVPGKGVYAALAEIEDSYYKAAVNIGNKPTFHEEFPISIEANLIDFDQDIYGKHMRLHIVQKIRDEQKFASMDDLVKQINLDRAKAIALGISRPKSLRGSFPEEEN